ncbi:MAG TPA: PQQ-binding-like beta-propeller repeat protein [Candidatus Binatia bacterium]|jgi:outer membrane protein assembly factor BamB
MQGTMRTCVRRRPALSWLGVAVLVSACNPPLQATWPKFHHDLFQQGRSQFSTSANNGIVKWTFDCGGAVRSSPAIADDGTIYVGSDDGHLYAINPTGSLKWKLAVGTGPVSSSPAVAADGTIYVGASDGLHAVNPIGTSKWTFPIIGGAPSSSPALSFAGQVYIGSTTGTVYAVDATGAQQWSYFVYPGPSIVGAPAVALNGTVYVGGVQSPDFLALDGAGNLVWQVSSGRTPGNTAAAIDAGGNVYVGWQNHLLEAFTSSGAFKWLFLTKSNIVGSAPAITGDGTIYVGSMDGILYAVNANGSEKWEYQTGAGIRGSSPAIGSDGTVFVGSTDGYVYAIDSAGSLRWRVLTQDTVNSSPAIGADGTVYVGADDHKLYALGEGATPIPGPTATPGPLCGNGVIDPGESCDPPNSFCPNSAPGFFCSNACQCDCPKTLEMTGIGMGAVVDRGWTGIAHDVELPSGGTYTVGITGCDSPSRPCGTCTLAGPVPNIYAANYALKTGGQINNRRCVDDTRVDCHGNGGCNSGTCAYYASTYIPVTVGGVSACVEQYYAGPVTGTVNLESGTLATNTVLAERIYSGLTVRIGCPRCLGDVASNDGKRDGTCAEGIDAGSSCDVNGSSSNPILGPTSFDCRPNPGARIASTTYPFGTSTSTLTKTLSAGSPSCRAPGFTGGKCVCDTCNDAAATACSSNADCTAVGATVCGGRRCTGGPKNGTPCSVNSQCPSGGCVVPGVQTAPNQCDGGALDCVPGGAPGPNDGICQTGPLETFCSPNGTMIQCGDDADCVAQGLRSCVGGTRAAQVCYATCAGGLSPGFRCSFDSDCGPGSTCTGSASPPTDCPGGTCAYETCSDGRFRECFLDRGQIGGHDDASGQSFAPMQDGGDPTLASLLCVGPTASSSVNGAVGLPGLERIERVTHLQARP